MSDLSYSESYNKVLLGNSCSRSSQRVFVIPRDLIERFGEKSARLIAQIHYLSTKKNFGKVYEGRRWVFNTFEYLADALCISLRHTQRLVADLSKQGVLHIKKLADYKSNRTNYYAIDYDRLNQLMGNMKSEDGIEANSQNNQQQIAACSRRNGGMVNTNKTNKIDNNKSEEEGRGQEDLEHHSNQVQRVNDIKNKNVLENQHHTPVINTEKPKSTIAQDMLAIWNQVITKAPAKMNKELARHLVAAHKAKFCEEDNLKAWKHYCQLIASSDYLMGEDFKLSLMWAIKFSTIERILNFDLGVKEIIQSQENFEQQALEHIQSVNESARCLDIRRKLLELYGAKIYLSWFKSLAFSEHGNQVCFKAPSRFHESYILQHFSDVLK